MTGCEMRKCKFWDGEKCNDEDIMYEEVCRYNMYWQTEEGQRELEQYEE
jgi:hypothetical protein